MDRSLSIFVIPTSMHQFRRLTEPKSKLYTKFLKVRSLRSLNMSFTTFMFPPNNPCSQVHSHIHLRSTLITIVSNPKPFVPVPSIVDIIANEIIANYANQGLRTSCLEQITQAWYRCLAALCTLVYKVNANS